MLAPIVVFSYNRPSHLKRTLSSLSKNDLAESSILYVFCDGAKSNASPDQLALVEETRRVAKGTVGFKEVHVIEREKNYGLANNIIRSVTDIVNQYGRVITLEDDILTSVGFLKYMNDALELYKDDSAVMHISGYMFPHDVKLPETFFFEVPYPTGGWATWKRAWDHFSNDIDALYDYWRGRWKEFNKFGDDYLQRQLEENKRGTLYTWFIKWHAVLLMNGGLTLYPGISLSNCIGFDNSGTNCLTTNKFDIKHPADYISVSRIEIKENKKAARIIRHFYSGHWYSKRYRRRLVARVKNWFSGK